MDDVARAGLPGVNSQASNSPSSCSPEMQVRSEQPQLRRHQRIDRLAPRFEATRFDRFPGGCRTAEAAVPAAHRAEVTSGLSAILHYTTRQTLGQALDERSDGRLRLDPPTPGSG
jgi:hypothetical protein